MSLGSIIVRLTMNTADFDTDAGRAAKIAERRAKQIDDAFRKAGTAIGLALGAGLVAAGAAMKSSIDRMDELSKASQKVGMPTEEFSRLAYAGELADVSMETLVGSLGKLTKAQAAALKETSEQAKVFDALGIAATNADGSLRPASEVLAEFADQFQAMKGSPTAMAAGFALFGRSFQEMIPLLKDGSAGIREASEEADRLGITLSTDAGKAAEQFNDDLTRLQSMVGGLTRDFATGLLPSLLDVTSGMVDSAEATNSAKDAGQLLGETFGIVATVAGGVADTIRSVTYVIAEMVNQTKAWYEIASNIGTLGFAPGTVKGGLNKSASGWQNLRGSLSDTWSSDTASPWANVSGGSSQLLQGRELKLAEARMKRQREAEDRLLGILGGGDKPASRGNARKSVGGASRAPEISEEAKAMERLNEQATRELESLKERLGLMGLETEAAKMKWETEEGAFKALDPLRKAELIAQAALVDAKQKAMDVSEEERRAAEEAQAGYDRAIQSVREEAATLGMTNEQLEIYNRLKAAGVDANSAFGQSIIAETQALQQQRQAMDDQIAVMDQFRDSATDALVDFASGAKTAEEALKDFFKTMADMILRMIAEKWMEQLFGQKGSDGSGTSGGGWLGALVGGFFSMFGGGGGTSVSGGSGSQFNWIGNGYASGGWTGPGATNQPAGIVHADEVVWSKGDVARAGGVAQVESMRRGSASVSSEAKRPLVVFSEAQMLDALAAHGGLEKVVVHYMERNRDRLRANA